MHRASFPCLVLVFLAATARAKGSEARTLDDGLKPTAGSGVEQASRLSRVSGLAADPRLNETTVAMRRDKDTSTTAEPAVHVGVAPAVMTSEAPEERAEVAEGDLDLSWLQGLQLPDIPVRWDDRVVRMLSHYRHTARGRSLARAWFRRTDRYGPMIRRKLREASLPEDLFYVAMVESAFDPKSTSQAGAVGMWQFVDASADDYGLERSRWVDQRMNPERSTDAAVRFFKDLHARLGAWELSLAAFNMGYGGLVRAMQKYNTNDFWVLSRLEAGLPYETVLYVAKVMACAVMGRNPARFGLDDLELDPPIRAAYVKVPGGVALGRLARAAGISSEELAALNPELKRPRIPPDVRDWNLRIPADKRAQFLQRWAAIRPRTSTHSTHVMRFGERLSDVAEMFGTTTAALRLLNELTPKDRLAPGFELLVPNVKPKKPSRSSDSEQPVVSVPRGGFVYPNRRRVFYRVGHRANLREIARFFSVTVDEICQWNAIAPEAALPRGIFLQLFVPKDKDLARVLVLTPEEARVLVVGTDEFFDYHEAQRDRVRIRYRVRPGDTMQTLAERFELSVGSIARINRFSSVTELQVDQEIIVYAPKGP